MAQILKVPSNELYTKIQSNTSLSKSFKKDILNLYKRHPSVATMALAIIDEVQEKKLAPNGASLHDAMAYHWEDKTLMAEAEELKQVREQYANYIDIAKGVMLFVFTYHVKSLQFYVFYYLIELENGEFKTVVQTS